ncbi:B12-binding domain-containing protein [Streptomyces sp. NBC_01013]|uniref:cobalamin B12-binding domain-containing protein n=1 Tax=Streptomyces sp. NBC_01013 TaxID=2903718 RepID=UPI003869258C|nr:cobalamin-dependent protein [Streptomyces sp. NBC_01013]
MTPYTTADDELQELQDRLWSAAVDRDEFAAAGLVFAALDNGMDAESVLLDVIAPVQMRVGTEWAANRITVAQEHAASAIAERVVAAVAHRPSSRTTPHLGRVTVACVEQEWHVLPARLLAEVLTLRGWEVDFLGAQVPTPHLVAHLHRAGADVVALSSSIPTRLPAAHGAITACQSVGVPVLVGGAAFGSDGRYARLLGADVWAPDARTAAQKLADGIAAPNLAAGRLQIDDLPHLSDQEYTLVTRSQEQLVKQVLTQMEERFPAMAAYSDQQRQRTAEDIAHIVEFLTVALYVDDDDLFTNFMTWTAGILTARDVSARSLHPALGILAAELNEFPRSTRLLDQARLALDSTAAAGGRHPGALT